MVVALTNTSSVKANTVSITGLPLYAIIPSNDTLTLLSANLNTVIIDNPNTIDLQTGVFGLNLSPIPDQKIPFVINQDAKINSITISIPFSFDAVITSTFDRLTLHPCEVFTFGDVNFKLLETATGDLDF